MDLDEFRFSAENLWVRIDDDNQAYIGLTEEALADKEEVAKIRLLSEGDEFVKDEPIGRLTTNTKTVIRLLAPVSGEVVEVNEEIIDTPEMIAEDPYEEGWLLRVELSNVNEFDDLMDREEYEDFLSEDLPDDDEDEEDEDEDLLDDSDPEDDDDDFDEEGSEYEY